MHEIKIWSVCCHKDSRWMAMYCVHIRMAALANFSHFVLGKRIKHRVQKPGCEHSSADFQPCAAGKSLHLSEQHVHGVEWMFESPFALTFQGSPSMGRGEHPHLSVGCLSPALISHGTEVESVL